MISSKMMIEAMDKLAKWRKLFWSEADFQFSLAQVLCDMLKEKDAKAQIFLERPIPTVTDDTKVKRRNRYIDILIKIGDTIYPIELKYATKEDMVYDDGEKILTTTQGAYDTHRFGYLYDIFRLESIRKELSNSTDLKFGRGFAILLTNDSNYYLAPTNDNYKNTIDGTFRIHDNNIIDSEIKWNIKEEDANSHWTSKYPYKVKFTLEKRPVLLWRDYENDVVTKFPLKYLINTI